MQKPVPDPSLPLANAKHEGVATLIADGETGADAYRKVYTNDETNTNSHRVSANRIRHRDDVSARIEYLKSLRESDHFSFDDLREARLQAVTSDKLGALLKFAGDVLLEAAKAAEKLGDEGRITSLNIRKALGVHTSRSIKIGGDAGDADKGDDGYDEWAQRVKRCDCHG